MDSLGSAQTGMRSWRAMIAEAVFDFLVEGKAALPVWSAITYSLCSSSRRITIKLTYLFFYTKVPRVPVFYRDEIERNNVLDSNLEAMFCSLEQIV
jgi:hypothetical protein